VWITGSSSGSTFHFLQRYGPPPPTTTHHHPPPPPTTTAHHDLAPLAGCPRPMCSWRAPGVPARQEGCLHHPIRAPQGATGGVVARAAAVGKSSAPWASCWAVGMQWEQGDAPSPCVVVHVRAGSGGELPAAGRVPGAGPPLGRAGLQEPRGRGGDHHQGLRSH
jgi:hypothetical protein